MGNNDVTGQKADGQKRSAAIARILAGYIRLVIRTSRRNQEFDNIPAIFDENDPVILAGWHGGFLLAPTLFPYPERVSAIVARHGDAEFIGGVLERFGIRLVRGAGAGGRRKDKGGAYALRMSLKELKAGRSITMTADVPPGPARKVGLGVITIARLSGRPILPAAAATSRFKVLNTWSRFVVNLPFSKLAVHVGEPVWVPRDADAQMMEQKRLELEVRLNQIVARAYEQVGADQSKLAIAGIDGAPKAGLSLKLYRAIMGLAEPVARPLLARRQKRGKEDPARRHERLGQPRLPRPDGYLIWMHAASVGETNAVIPLIKRLVQAYPTANVMLTTGTVTSSQIAAERLPERAFHQFIPLDVPRFIREFLDHWQPDLTLFVESEIWPNMVLDVEKRGIPLVLLNARMSANSYKGWRKRPGLARPLFGRFDLILAQNQRLRQRFFRLGAPNVEVSGNLKLDTPPPHIDADARAELQSAISGRPLLLAASTHPGEDEVVLDAAARMREEFPRLLTIILPRHPERGDEIVTLAEGQGLQACRRSNGRLPEKDIRVYVADTLGEIGLFYKLAAFSFIGGSLVRRGGQNPIEAIYLDTKVLVGPHVFNFEDSYEALATAGCAVTVQDAEELAKEAAKALRDPQQTLADAQKGPAALEPLMGALERTLDALKPYIDKGRGDKSNAA